MKEYDIDVGGISLRVSEWGDAASPVTLILHGWLDQGASWEPVASALSAAGHRIVAPDHRGHGLSEHAPSHSHYHFPDYIADLDRLITALKISSFSLLGHSMGGTIASIYASLFPEKIRKLVLVEGLGVRDEKPEASLKRYRSHIRQRRSATQHKPMADLSAAADRLLDRNPLLLPERARFLASRMTRQHDAGLVWTWDPRHRDRSASSMPASRYAHILQQLQVPTTFVSGTDSPYGRWADVQGRLGEIKVLTGHLNIKGGHSLHFDNPAGLSEALLRILSFSVGAE